MSFGQLIRQARESKRISMECISHETGKSIAYWSMIERDLKPAPSDELISAAARVIGVDADAAFIAAGRLPPDLRGKIGDVVALFRNHGVSRTANA